MKKLLILAAKPYVRSWYARYLTAQGFNVLTAADIDEALGMVWIANFDLALVHVGRDAIERSYDVERLRFHHPDILIVLNTIHGLEHAVLPGSGENIWVICTTNLGELTHILGKMAARVTHHRRQHAW